MDTSNTSANESNEMAILHFQEICSTEDRNEACLYLQRYDWDIETAVQEYLADKDNFTSSNPSVERAQNQQNHYLQEEINAVRNMSSVPRAVPIDRLSPRRTRYPVRQQPPVGWLQWSWQLVQLPVKFFFVTLYDIWRFTYRIFFPFNRAIANPAEDVDKFIAEYESKYGANHPTFYRGSYSQALNDARKELKFLCIYLHCDTHRDTANFCRNTLNNKDVVEFLNTKTLLWACSVKLREGYRVSQAMHETTYPFVALVCLRENRMMVVVRQEGALSAVELLDMLTTVMSDNEVYLAMARQERQSQRLNQVLREQQEQAFEESLQRDREKERRRMDAERDEREREQRERRDQRLVAEMRERLAIFKENRRRLNATTREPPIADDGVVRVSVKFLTGARFERRFLADDSLLLLFNAIVCHDDCPENFSVYNVIPRQLLLSAKLLQPDENSIQPTLRFTSFQEAGLQTSASLIVQDDEA